MPLPNEKKESQFITERAGGRDGKNTYAFHKSIEAALSGKVIMYATPVGNVAILSWDKYEKALELQRQKFVEEIMGKINSAGGLGGLKHLEDIINSI